MRGGGGGRRALSPGVVATANRVEGEYSGRSVKWWNTVVRNLGRNHYQITRSLGRGRGAVVYQAGKQGQGKTQTRNKNK